MQAELKLKKRPPYDFILEELGDIVTAIKPMFGVGPTAWQVLGEDLQNFEEVALQICELIRKNDHRIGRTPKTRFKKKTKKIK